ncbi:hypothetical protein [Streptomyces sp. NPDC000994]
MQPHALPSHRVPDGRTGLAVLDGGPADHAAATGGHLTQDTQESDR